MNTYNNFPGGLPTEWIESVEQHAGGERFPFHYHSVEEWLLVEQGRICFYTAAGDPHWVEPSQGLQIPRGEIHRVEVGGSGVTYRMWLPASAPSTSFANRVEPEDLTLVEKNLAFPAAEDSGDVSFFNDVLSDYLVFRAASGDLFDKSGFMSRGFTNRQRISSGSVRILDKAEATVLLSTIVRLPQRGSWESYINERLFVREDGDFKCRVWMNYREATAA